MATTYNWQQPHWPEFRYDESALSEALQLFAQKTGYLQGLLAGIPAAEAEDAVVEILTSEALKTAQIEGELLNRKDVRASVQNNLGLGGKPLNIADRRAAGIGDLIMEVQKNLATPLTAHLLKNWHKRLFGGSRQLRK